MKKKTLIYMLLSVVLLSLLAIAVPFTPTGNVDLRARYGVINITELNFSSGGVIKQDTANSFILNKHLNMSGKNITDIDVLRGADSSPINIGEGCQTSQGFTSPNDLVTCGKAEFNGVNYIDGQTIVGHAVALWLGGASAAGDAQIAAYSQAYNELKLGLSVNTGTQLVLTKTVNIGNDHDHPELADPTLYLHSSTAPDSNNSLWMSIAYVNTSLGGLIKTGVGDIKLNPASGTVNLSSGGYITDNGTALILGHS